MIRWLVNIVFFTVLILAACALFFRSEIAKYRKAFLYAYGPYEFSRSIQELSAQVDSELRTFAAPVSVESNSSGPRAAFLNRQAHNIQLADHTQRTVTTPNNDTLYTSAVLELSSTPVELVLPDVGDRYLSVALMDVFTDQFAHIGPRETRGQGGVYWIVGPDDKTPTPEGVTAIRATGNDVWLLARTFVAGEADLSGARDAQQGITVRPVFPDRPAKPFANLVTEIEDSENFIAVTNEALARNSTHPQSLRAKQFEALGLGRDTAPGPFARFLWSLVTTRAEAAIKDEINRTLWKSTAWSIPPRNIGYYGEDDRLRAAIALIGFGALRREDAIYYRMTKTADGAALDGTKTYQMMIPPGVPEQAFWSIAVYEPDETGRFFFFENPTGRHSLNSKSDTLQFLDNGDLAISIGPTAPTDPDLNWMPTPDGPFAVFFRIYLPEEAAVRNDGV
ncbi:MAG: DUF1254 domain-containing protein, partial [Pseudomonadota bacterium]